MNNMNKLNSNWLYNCGLCQEPITIATGSIFSCHVECVGKLVRKNSKNDGQAEDRIGGSNLAKEWNK
jgi:hypothetical protein